MDANNNSNKSGYRVTDYFQIDLVWTRCTRCVDKSHSDRPTHSLLHHLEAVDLVTDGLEVALLGQAGQQVADADVELLLALELRRERDVSRRPGGGTKVQGSIPTWKHHAEEVYPLPASEQKACISIRRHW